MLVELVVVSYTSWVSVFFNIAFSGTNFNAASRDRLNAHFKERKT